MRFVLNLLALIAVALVVGFGLSTYALTDGRLVGSVRLGAWSAWPDIGAPQPNPYTRAHIAREGALQLGASEGLELVATTDDSGEPLDLACTYTLAGHVPVSSFWTLAAVDRDWVNLAVPDGRPALRSSGIVRTNEGAILVHLGTRLMPGNWLELSGSGPFMLVLTLYDTTALTGFSSTAMTMPSLTRRSCT